MIIIGGEEVEIPGLVTRSFAREAALTLSAQDQAPRRGEPHGIVLHTTLGIPGPGDLRTQVILHGGGDRSAVHAVTWWRTSPGYASAHFLVDADGSVICCADPIKTVTYHAGRVNAWTIGIEMLQRQSDAGIFEATLHATAELVHWLTDRLRICRMIPDQYRGPLSRWDAEDIPFWGVFGHRDVTASRGHGDPGDRIFEILDYEKFDLSTSEDVSVWRQRQTRLGVLPDGVPGPVTLSAWRELGLPCPDR